MTKSQSIHDIFELCLDLVFSGESIEECVRRFPDHENELRNLLETATVVKKAASVQPSAGFRGRTRQQLETALHERAEIPQRTGFRWDWQPRWAVATAVFLTVLVAGSGIVLAADSSMPDQALYAVKQATEHVRLVLASSPTAKATVYTTLADRRIDEIVYLATEGKSTLLLEVTQGLDSDLNRIADLLVGVDQDNQGAVRYGDTSEKSGPLAVPATIPSPTTVTATSIPTSGEGVPEAPNTVPAPEASYFLSLPQKANNAAQVQLELAVPAGSSSAYLERAKLKARVLYQSAQYSVRLTAALTNVPDETRPALLRAIAISQTGYEKLLQSFELQP